VAPTGPPCDSKRILVVEDDEDSGLMLRYLLELAGHQVCLARNGRTALAAAVNWRPEIVISDLGLPGDLDGFALARALRADARSAPAFLVALSGLGRSQDKARARAAGFQLYLTKPIDMETLEAAVAQVADRYGHGSFDSASAARS
jgi:DNA-binding response OmpR family regulator